MKCKNKDLEKIDRALNDDCNFRQLPKQPLFVPTLGRPCAVAQYARSRVLRNPTVGQLVTYFRRSRGGVGGGRDRGLGGKMVLLGPARVLAVEQPTEVESQVAAVVWLAHGGSLMRAGLDCSSLSEVFQSRFCVTWCFMASKLANPDSVLPGASWMLGKIPMVENRNSMVTFSNHGQLQLLYWHLQLQNQSPQQPVRNSDNSSSRVSAVRFRDSS